MNALLSSRLVKLIKIHPVVGRKVHPMSTTSRTAKLCSIVHNCIPFGCFTTQGTFRKASRKIKCEVAVSKIGVGERSFGIAGQISVGSKEAICAVTCTPVLDECWAMNSDCPGKNHLREKKSSSYSGYSSLRAGMVTTSGCPTNRKKSKYKTIFSILWLTGLLWMVANRILWYMAFVGTVDDLNVDFSHQAFLL